MARIRAVSRAAPPTTRAQRGRPTAATSRSSRIATDAGKSSRCWPTVRPRRPSPAAPATRHVLRFRQVRHPPRRREDARRERQLAEVEFEPSRAHRGSLRRARYQRIQPRARRTTRQVHDELSGVAGRAGQPHHHHQLRGRAPTVHRAQRSVLGQEPPRALPRQAPVASDSMARGRYALLLAPLLVGGCASVQDVTGVATHPDHLQLRTDVTIAQQRAQRALGEAEAALAQAQRRERERDGEAERRLAALAERGDALTSSLTTLSGQLDELNSRVDALSRQPRAAAPAPAAPRPPGTVTAVPAPAAPPAAGGNRPTTNALQPQDIYQASYLDFSKGSYALAIAGFREFLRRFPDQALAGAAQCG